MKNYPIVRRKNTDIRIINALKQILAQCEEYGCRPVLRPYTELGREIATIQHTLNARKRKELPIPAEIIELYKKILSYPTFYQHNKRVLQKQEENNRIAQNIKCEKFKQDFPNAELIFVILGQDTFKHVVNANRDKGTTKFLAEYLDFVVSNVINKESREYEILMMYIGNSADSCAQDKKITFKSETLPFSPCGIHPSIIAEKYGLSKTRIVQILSKIIYKLRKSINPDVFKHYIAGDTDAMLKSMPTKLQVVFRFQQRTQIADMETAELKKAGWWMLNNFDTKVH